MKKFISSTVMMALGVGLLVAHCRSAYAQAVQPSGAGGVSLSGSNTWTALQTFSGGGSFASGTAAVPSIQWTADADGSGTGLYRTAANNVGVSVNGTRSFAFIATAGVLQGISANSVLTMDDTKGIDMTYNGNSEIQIANNAITLTNAAASPIRMYNGVRYNIGGQAEPTCDATIRGTIWYTAGGAGVADKLRICVKPSTDVYAWQAISTLIP